MHDILDFFRTLTTKEGMETFISLHGALVAYIVLFAIIFAETGLLVGFVLPGDSLLVVAGLVAATGKVPLDIWTLDGLLIAATILGDASGYFIGRRSGPRLMRRPNGRIFKHEYLER